MEKWINEIIEEKRAFLDSAGFVTYLEEVEKAGNLLVEVLKNGNKVLLAGNGGSAADAQHFAAEMVGRLYKERRSFPFISLCTDPSTVTSISNDYGYDEVFARQIEGIGVKGDCFVGISTSGNSGSILKAIEVSNDKGIHTIGLLGRKGGSVVRKCEQALIVPLEDTQRIQEIHTLTIHILCGIIERNLSADD